VRPYEPLYEPTGMLPLVPLPGQELRELRDVRIEIRGEVE
jgi:hypothetical protein